MISSQKFMKKIQKNIPPPKKKKPFLGFFGGGGGSEMNKTRQHRRGVKMNLKKLPKKKLICNLSQFTQPKVVLRIRQNLTKKSLFFFFFSESYCKMLQTKKYRNCDPNHHPMDVHDKKFEVYKRIWY